MTPPSLNNQVSPWTLYKPFRETSVEKMKILKITSIKKAKTMYDPPSPPSKGPSPWSDIIMTSWHSENILKRNGPKETKTNIISRHSGSHWQPANQRRGSHACRVTWLAERCECWLWRAAEYFYSVAEGLLPPGGEQKYTHRYLQYIQTEIL